LIRRTPVKKGEVYSGVVQAAVLPFSPRGKGGGSERATRSTFQMKCREGRNSETWPNQEKREGKGEEARKKSKKQRRQTSDSHDRHPRASLKKKGSEKRARTYYDGKGNNRGNDKEEEKEKQKPGKEA